MKLEELQKKTIEELQKLVGENDYEAMYLLGSYYLKGKYIEKNEKIADELFSKVKEICENEKDMTSYSYLARLYYNGYGVECNYKLAREYFKICYDSDIYANYFLGKIYFFGDYGVEKNYKLARRYFNKCPIDDKFAQGFLGDIYYYGGYGVEKSYKKAVRYYNRCKDEKDNDTIITLGYIYYYGGYGIEKNYKKAFKYFQEANQEDIDVIYHFGKFYYYGNNVVKKDYKKSKQYFLQCEKNEKYKNEARYYLGLIHYFGNNGIIENDKQAIKYFEKLTEDKKYSSKSNWYLGKIYYFGGKNIEKDYKKAVKYLEASKEDDSDRYYYLAVMYNSGKYGIDINTNKALKYFKLCKSDLVAMYYAADIYYHKKDNMIKAKEYFEKTIKLAEKDNKIIDYKYYKEAKEIKNYILNDSENYFYKVACALLGKMYYYGELGEENNELAIKYWEKSCDRILFINYYLGNAYRFIKNYEKARYYYEKFIETNSNTITYDLYDSYYQLAILYYLGRGGDYDLKKSKQYFEKAAKEIEEANFYLGQMYLDGIEVEIDKRKAYEYFYIVEEKVLNSHIYCTLKEEKYSLDYILEKYLILNLDEYIENANEIYKNEKKPFLLGDYGIIFYRDFKLIQDLIKEHLEIYKSRGNNLDIHYLKKYNKKEIKKLIREILTSENLRCI